MLNISLLALFMGILAFNKQAHGVIIPVGNHNEIVDGAALKHESGGVQPAITSLSGAHTAVHDDMITGPTVVMPSSAYEPVHPTPMDFKSRKGTSKRDGNAVDCTSTASNTSPYPSGPATVTVWTEMPQSTAATNGKKHHRHGGDYEHQQCGTGEPIIFENVGYIAPGDPCYALSGNNTMWNMQLNGFEGCKLFFYTDDTCISPPDNWYNKGWAYLGTLNDVTTDSCIGPQTELQLVSFLNEDQLTTGFRGFQITCDTNDTLASI